MILVFGSINMDLLVPVATLPRAGETVLSPTYRTAPGGGEAMGIRPVDAPTGIAVVATDEAGENQILVCVGANMAVAEEMVSDELLSSCSTLLMQMEVPLKAVFTLAPRARAMGRRVILNAAPAGPIMPDTIDVLVLNQGEARQVAAETGIEAGDAMALADRLFVEHGVATVVTLGAEGAVALGPDGAWKVGALELGPVDTVGAGDAFTGTLAAALDAGLDWPEALRRASVAGSLACLEPGAMPSLPTAAAVDARLDDLAPARPLRPA